MLTPIATSRASHCLETTTEFNILWARGQIVCGVTYAIQLHIFISMVTVIPTIMMSLLPLTFYGSCLASWFGPAFSGGGENAGPLRWRSLLTFSPPLLLAYSGRSEDQQIPFNLLFWGSASLFVSHQFCGIFRDIRSRDSNLSELLVVHIRKCGEHPGRLKRLKGRIGRGSDPRQEAD